MKINLKEILNEFVGSSDRRKSFLRRFLISKKIEFQILVFSAL